VTRGSATPAIGASSLIAAGRTHGNGGRHLPNISSFTQLWLGPRCPSRVMLLMPLIHRAVATIATGTNRTDKYWRLANALAPLT
jgi:hypothetical protein